MSSRMSDALEKYVIVQSIGWCLGFTSYCRFVQCNRFVHSLTPPDELPDELLHVPGSMHIRREMTLNKLVEHARHNSRAAIREMLSRLLSTDEHEHVRCWTVRSIVSIAEQGEQWAIKGIAQMLLLERVGLKARRAALDALTQLVRKGTAQLICLAIGVLVSEASDGKVADADARDVRQAALRAIQKFTRLIPLDRIDAESMQSLVELMDNESEDRRLVAIDALSRIAPRGNSVVIDMLIHRLRNCSVNEQRGLRTALERLMIDAPREELDRIIAMADFDDLDIDIPVPPCSTPI
eukprot:TRINITY_DN30167_c0_g1_i1.p1 TRINITY_DN30167_c0_g1~~TRINITY_DN30167_c0_g1_i1.p1  ORF type:complete len:295 (-),score=41.72 TRINITY_DN30167_c0_g1_i1:218-1102(-)